MAQVVDLFRGKGALFGPQLKVSMPESLEDLPESSEVFFPGGRKDDNIVEVKQACFPVEAGKDAIHQAREGGGSVTKTEWDLIEFAQLPTAGTKGGLCFVALLNWDLPIATLQVQGCEPLSAVERVEEVIYPGQWVCVLDGSCV